MHRAAILGGLSDMRHPSSLGFVAPSIPDFGTHAVVEEPPLLVSNHLVVVVVEHSVARGYPHVRHQGVHDEESAKGVSSKQGNNLLSIHVELRGEEIHGVIAASNSVGMNLLLASFVREGRIRDLAVGTARSEGNRLRKADLTSVLSKKVVALSLSVVVGVILAQADAVVSFNTPFNSHDGSQRPQIGSTLARISGGLLQDWGASREIGTDVDSFQHLDSRTQPVVVGELDVVVNPFETLLVEKGFHAVPVETAVAATSPVSVLDAVMEGESKKLGWCRNPPSSVCPFGRLISVEPFCRESKDLQSFTHSVPWVVEDHSHLSLDIKNLLVTPGSAWSPRNISCLKKKGRCRHQESNVGEHAASCSPH